MEILDVEHISGGYNQEIILQDISFNVIQGEFIGIIGPNGSGKSTLLKTISRVLVPQHGTITFEGKNIYTINLKEFCRKVANVSQNIQIEFPYTIEEIVLMGRIPHLNRLQITRVQDLHACEQAMIFTDIMHLKTKRIDQISSGERQRVFMAKALAQEPVLMLLDEPTSHLDIGHQVQILNLLKKLNKKNKVTIVVVLHDLNLASEYCERLILLDQGKIHSSGKPDEVLTYQNIESVYKTIVVVNKNPISSKPYVLLVSGERN
ncbi:MAG: ABC transporter ATP-binding protein [bacterium]